MLPWSEMDSLQLETGYIKDQLVALNKKGFLTINSQPCVNGQPSTDEKVGWGGPNGCVPVLLPRVAGPVPTVLEWAVSHGIPDCCTQGCCPQGKANWPLLVQDCMLVYMDMTYRGCTGNAQH